jgi:hypothetical protein
MITLLALILVGFGIYLGSSWVMPQQAQKGPPVSLTTPEQQFSHRASEPEKGQLSESESEGGNIAIEPQLQTPRPQQVEEARALKPPLQAEEVDLAPVVKAVPAPPAQPPKPLHEMPSGFVANLPSLSIDIHSYDKRPAKRYVLINMEKYREGDYVSEGPRVLEILPQGAVLEHMGERFVLPIGNY